MLYVKTFCDILKVNILLNLKECFVLQIEECVVCSDKKASVLFMPCAHMCACDGKNAR